MCGTVGMLDFSFIYCVHLIPLDFLTVDMASLDALIKILYRRKKISDVSPPCNFILVIRALQTYY